MHRDRAVVVGDSVWDSRGELESAGARAAYRDPNDLRAHLDEWIA